MHNRIEEQRKARKAWIVANVVEYIIGAVALVYVLNAAGYIA